MNTECESRARNLHVGLTPEQLLMAASLGGMFISQKNVSEHLVAMQECADVEALTLLYARIGIRRAVENNFERIFPSRYPDDVLNLADNP